MTTHKYVVSKEESSVLNKLPGAICIFQDIDDDVLMIFANKASLKMFNMSYDELVNFYNKDLYNFTHPEDANNLKVKTRKMLRGENLSDFSYRVKLNGSEDYSLIHERWNLVRTDDGCEIGLVAMSDLTREMKSQDTKIRLLSKKYDDAMRNKARTDTNLMTFIQFDLTEDRIIGGDFSKDIKVSFTWKDLLQNECNNIIDENQKLIFKNTLTEEYVRECAYSSNGISLTYKRKAIVDKKSTMWVRLDINFSDNPMNNNNLAYIYLYDINSEVVTDIFLKYAITDIYDYIQRIDLNNDSYTTFISNIYRDKYLSRLDGNDYFKQKDRKDFFGYQYLSKLGSQLNKEYLIDYLSKNDKYSKDFTIIEDESNLKYKRITIKYVDELKDSICLAQQDFTESMIEELEKNMKLENALKEAEKASVIKTKFLANMSHDMRTPMNAIIGLSSFGVEETKEIKSKEYFKQIIDSSEYLLNLLNDLLDMNKLESGSVILNNQVVDMKSLISEIQSIVKTKADNKKQQFTITLNKDFNDKLLKIDKQRVQQILINVLSNAIKYTNKNGYINWDVRFEKADKKDLMINKISDNGVGISQENLPYIFDAFYQERNNLSKSEEGSGLGLAITKNLLELMDGDIKCTSKLGEGSEFTITIPMGKCESEDEKCIIKENVSYEYSILYNKKILLCEDNNINAKIARKMLEQQNIKVDLACNGEEACKMVEAKEYDCIIMDIKMPVMDGITAAKNIRLKDNNTPIIALSANAYEEDINESLSVGMNANLAKPIDKEKLYKSLIKNIKGD